MTDTSFSCRSARSASLVVVMGLAITVETVVLHLLLAARHPWAAWSLTVSSIGILAWLVADFSAMGHSAVRLGDETIRIDVGHRLQIAFARSALKSATRPEWRHIPQRGTPAAAGYLNPMRPSDPNVLLTFSEALPVRVMGGFHRTVTRLGLQVDEPDLLLSALTFNARALDSLAHDTHDAHALPTSGKEAV